MAWGAWQHDKDLVKEGNAPRWPPKIPKATQDRTVPDRPGEDAAVAAREAKSLGFDNNNYPGHWEFVGTLGVGGFGHAGAWVQYNSTGEITNRMVFKESYMNDVVWRNRSTWMGPETKEEPREAHIQDLLCKAPGGEHIVRLNAYKIYAQKRMCRLYLDYCPNGDLGDLWYSHGFLDQMKDDQGAPIDRFIPEHALWSIFHSLAKALVLLDGKDIPVDPTKERSRPVIFHRDLKPINIFLSSVSDQGDWRGLPTVKLADFGAAIECPCPTYGLPDPRWNSTGRGNEGFMAPEGIFYGTTDEEHRAICPHAYSNASDVFSVGLVMYYLIALVTSLGRRQPQFDDQAVTEIRDFSAQVKAKFSEQLLGLVLECLEMLPTNRPAAEILLGRIEGIVKDKTRAGGAWVERQFGGPGQVLRYGRREGERSRMKMRDAFAL